ncbi:MAG: sulfite exporter TauE/SafE family protein [Candidatus Firestonebacteria bacterium]|nr:sulfite exporter TauE/SafE family protein [Candidatus Firestonebacteria bacterium]
MTETINQLAASLKIALQDNFLLAYGLIFLAGILTSFEPCIYTMLPVTVTFISTQAGGSKIKGFFLSVIYVLGIAVTYTILGMAAALTGSVFGQLQSSIWPNILMGVVCIGLALSMFDLYEIRIPAFISNLAGKRVGSGYITIFFLGLISGLVVGPCAGAVLLVALAYVAKSHNVLFGGTLLFTFSMGMGILLLIVGTFSGLLMALPKAGQWMSKIRKFMGVAMIVIGLYFFYQVYLNY